MKWIKKIRAIRDSIHMIRVSGAVRYCSGTVDILAVVRGKLFLVQPAGSFSEEDVFAVMPGHTLEMNCTEECIILRFSLPAELLLELTGIFRILSCPLLTADDGGIFFHKLIRYKNQLSAAGDSSLPLPLCALEFLEQKEKEQILASIPETASTSPHQKRKLESILLFIYENLSSPLSLAEAAETFSITPQYLASFWKKYMGKTFQQYVRECRLAFDNARSHFLSLREETGFGSSLPEGSGSAGFGSSLPEGSDSAEVSCRSFTAISENTIFEILPDRGIDDPSVEFCSRSKDGISPDRIQRRKITIPICSGTPFSNFWKRLINLGYSSDFSSNLLFSQIEKLQTDIGFEYGRICRVFDLIEKTSLGNRAIYDYEQIFHLLDVMVRNHLHPFFELSNKLYRLHLSHHEMVPLNAFPDPSEYYDELLLLLPDFLKTCCNRYGKEEVRTWRFEISYVSYDYRDFSCDFPLRKYVSYFKKIKLLLNTCIPECRTGGPGFNGWERKEQILEMLECFKSQEVFPDFLTAYLYPSISENDREIPSGDTNEFLLRLSEFEQIVRRQFPGLEIWITEFNSNLSSQNMMNDSIVQSSFLTDFVIRSARTGISAMGYYMLSDHSFRSTDTTSLLFGGPGLLSDRDIPKPSYYTYRLFSRLGKTLIYCCDCLLLTSDSDSCFQCLVCGRKNPTSEFLQKNVTIRDLENYGRYDSGAEKKILQIELEQMPPGRYMVSEYSISVHSGNILNAWKQLNYLTPSSYEAVRLLIESTEIKPQIYAAEVYADGRLSLFAELEDQESRFYQIEKLPFI